MYRSLAEFMEDLDRAGQLARVRVEVDAELELAEVARRMGQIDGPAIVFEAVKGHSLPVLVNLLGTSERMCRALDVGSIDEAASKVQEAMHRGSQPGWLARLRDASPWSSGAAPATKPVRTGDCQQVVHLATDVNLASFPIPRLWPLESRPQLSSATLLTWSPQQGVRGLGRYRLEVLDRNSLAVHWHPGDAAAEHYQQYHRLGEKMPLAVVCGGDPLLPLAATMSGWLDGDPLELVGWLRDKPLEMVSCRTLDLDVPSGAEIILEGTVDPRGELVPAGPVSQASGYYSEPRSVPRLEISAITHRVDPVLPVEITAAHSVEAGSLEQAALAIWLPVARQWIPELVAWSSIPWGSGIPAAVVSIRKTHPAHAQQIAGALWSRGPLTRAKILIVVDERIDVTDFPRAWSELAANVDPVRDLFFHQGPAAPQDHSLTTSGHSRKLGIDATAKLAGEHPRPWPAALEMERAVRHLVTSRWGQYGLGQDPGELE